MERGDSRIPKGWCRVIGHHSLAEYLARVREFHGYEAPGLLLGGFMVEAVRRMLPEGVLFEAFCETKSCLPDAVQLLTPCTIGNGRLRVVNLGRYALSLYEKYEGRGFRACVQANTLASWPELDKWLMKKVPKQEQDTALLLKEISQAHADILAVEPIRVRPRLLRKKAKGAIAICPICAEGYPAADGGICRGCQGEEPYEPRSLAGADNVPGPLALTAIPVEDSVGKTALHDMTRIVPGVSKGPAVSRAEEITAGDVCRLQRMGRAQVYVAEHNAPGWEWVHEDDAARAFATAMAGHGVELDGSPREGKITLSAKNNGLFVADTEKLASFNLCPGVVCASRHSFSTVEAGMALAATRAIPLYLSRVNFERALSILSEEPLLFRVEPMRRAKVGILVTGSEVFQGLVEDKFIPIMTAKVARFGCPVVDATIVPDDKQAIQDGLTRLIAAGADCIVTTAGLSVDPDDVTKPALEEYGITDCIYGIPVLPGAMTLVGRLCDVQVIGVPACALYCKTTSFDILFPRLLARIPITRRDMARLGNGGICLDCRTCTYPKCPFGR